jgi:LysM repeat protein
MLGVKSLRGLSLAGLLGLITALALLAAPAAGATVAQQGATATPSPTQTAPPGFIRITVLPGESLATYVTRYGVSAQAIIAANPALQQNPNVIFPGQTLLIPQSTTTVVAPTATGTQVTSTAAPTGTPRTPTAVPTSRPTNTVPPPTATLQAPSGFVAVRVAAGETLITFVRRYGVSAQAIIAANPALQRDPNVLTIGQVLLIPIVTPTAVAPVATATPVPAGGTPNASGFIEVVVQPGETLLTFVQRYNVSASAILAVNPALQRDPNLLQIGQRIRIPIAQARTATPVAPTAAPGGPTTTPGPVTATPGSALPTAPALANSFQVTVRAGESLLVLSQRFGVRGAALLAVNPQLGTGENVNIVYPGQVINIPLVRSTTPSRTTPFFYTIQSGETINTLAGKFEIGAGTLQSANPGVSFNPGVEILVPAGPRLVTVRQGDELRTIAARYGVTVEFLLTSNSLPNPDRIYPGQLILIPIQYGAAPLAY